MYLNKVEKYINISRKLGIIAIASVPDYYGLSLSYKSKGFKNFSLPVIYI